MFIQTVGKDTGPGEIARIFAESQPDFVIRRGGTNGFSIFARSKTMRKWLAGLAEKEGLLVTKYDKRRLVEVKTHIRKPQGLLRRLRQQ